MFILSTFQFDQIDQKQPVKTSQHCVHGESGTQNRPECVENYPSVLSLAGTSASPQERGGPAELMERASTTRASVPLFCTAREHNPHILVRPPKKKSRKPAPLTLEDTPLPHLYAKVSQQYRGRAFLCSKNPAGGGRFQESKRGRTGSVGRNSKIHMAPQNQLPELSERARAQAADYPVHSSTPSTKHAATARSSPTWGTHAQ